MAALVPTRKEPWSHWSPRLDRFKIDARDEDPSSKEPLEEINKISKNKNPPSALSPNQEGSDLELVFYRAADWPSLVPGQFPGSTKEFNLLGAGQLG